MAEDKKLESFNEFFVCNPKCGSIVLNMEKTINCDNFQFTSTSFQKDSLIEHVIYSLADLHREECRQLKNK